MSADHDIVMMR